MNYQLAILGVFVSSVTGTLSILAITRPHLFALAIERWVNWILRKKSNRKTFEESRMGGKRLAIRVIRITGVVGIVETVILVIMLLVTVLSM